MSTQTITVKQCDICGKDIKEEKGTHFYAKTKVYQPSLSVEPVMGEITLDLCCKKCMNTLLSKLTEKPKTDTAVEAIPVEEPVKRTRRPKTPALVDAAIDTAPKQG